MACRHARALVVASIASCLLLPSAGRADDLPGWVKGDGIPLNVRGSADGPLRAKGYSHPDQFIHVKAVKPADNMFPVVPHPEQDRKAREKLAALQKRFGKKPNVVVFLLDDVGWMDPGFNGGGIAVGNDTPVMDRLASGGLVLTSAYSTPSCSPTRASIHTGLNPLHHGILRPPMYGEGGGLEGFVTLPALLKKEGYVTQAVGKWHMGANRGSLPQNVGYDDFLGFLSVSDEYTEWRDQYFNPEIALSPERFRLMEEMPFNHFQVHCTPSNRERCDDVRLIELNFVKELDTVWARYSVEFIKRMKGSKQPFFLYHATRGCHFDNYPNDRWLGSSRSRTTFGDCMAEMDHVLGQLVAALEETGELENTLVLFSSDNGPECEIPPHGRAPFRGCKGSSWEGGVRVPTFAYWKGTVRPRRSEGLFDLADVMPTVMSLVGHPGKELAALLPATTYVDGVDQASFLVADDGQSARKARIYTLNQYLSGIRVDEFKYVFTAEIENAFFQRGYWGGFTGAVATVTGGVAMVNLYVDPKEDVGSGVRQVPMAVSVGAELDAYVRDLMRYPPRSQIGFNDNNPALYNTLPGTRALIEEELKKRQEPPKGK
jgi:arylsulfatase